MWELYQRNDGRYVLRYHARNPIYRELPESSRSGNKLNGQRSFITEVCAAGLLEWGITPLVTRDSSRLDLMKESAADGLVGSLPHQYLDKLERIEQGYETIRKDEPGHYDKLKRETIADMILIFEEHA